MTDFRNVYTMSISKQGLVVLSPSELKFLEDLKKGKIDKYNKIYIRTLKHRILKKHKKLAHEALLIDEVLYKLQSL
jgi:CRISPR/Cas system endoribonuclease Cas6 (RAMP superfamily)